VPGARLASASNESLAGELIALVAGAARPIAELVRSSSDSPNQIAKVRGATTILVGSERHGLPDHLTAEAHHTAHIPIESQSLNAAMAATIALYELTQRAHA
jgi:tRNA G18 (ribose-2'-O)-methylase SpoU